MACLSNLKWMEVLCRIYVAPASYHCYYALQLRAEGGTSLQPYSRGSKHTSRCVFIMKRTRSSITQKDEERPEKKKKKNIRFMPRLSEVDGGK